MIRSRNGAILFVWMVVIFVAIDFALFSFGFYLKIQPFNSFLVVKYILYTWSPLGASN